MQPNRAISEICVYCTSNNTCGTKNQSLTILFEYSIFSFEGDNSIIYNNSK